MDTVRWRSVRTGTARRGQRAAGYGRSRAISPMMSVTAASAIGVGGGGRGMIRSVATTGRRWPGYAERTVVLPLRRGPAARVGGDRPHHLPGFGAHDVRRPAVSPRRAMGPIRAVAPGCSRLFRRRLVDRLRAGSEGECRRPGGLQMTQRCATGRTPVAAQASGGIARQSGDNSTGTKTLAERSSADPSMR